MFSYEQAYSYADRLEGWFYECEARALWDACVAAVEHYGVLEVGCWRGRSTAILACFLNGRNLPLTIVDPCIFPGVTNEDFLRLLRLNLDPLGTPYRLIQKRTSELTKQDLPLAVDVLHVDGDHSADGIRTDCEVVLPLVRPGGYACFHDYGNPDHPAIAPTVDSYTAGWEVIGTFHVLRVVRRKGEKANAPTC